jgi:hypothetical protein
MQLANVARTEIKQHIVAIVITLIITIGYWGAGFWALDQPDWGGGVDRPIYINAARNFFAQENLYVDINRVLPDDLIFYNYSPLSILWVGLVSLLPPAVLYVLHLVAVVALFFLWKAIFQKIQLEIPAWIIPIWCVYSAFLYDAITLNINVFLALLATLYLWFNLEDDRFARLGAILTLFLIITTKPQWGFLALLPLVQRQWKKFLEISAGITILYLFLWGLASILTSPGYVLEQHILFAKHLGTFTQRFSYWNLPPGPYEYNNSTHQVASGLSSSRIRSTRVVCYSCHHVFTNDPQHTTERLWSNQHNFLAVVFYSLLCHSLIAAFELRFFSRDPDVSIFGGSR